MADYTLNELAASAGTNTGNTLLDIANRAADFMCDLYRDYPGGIIPSLNTPASRFTDGLARAICAPRNKLPPNVTPPATGGQCATTYTLQSQAQEPNCTFTNPSNRGNFVGPISGMSYTEGNRQPTGGPNGEFSGGASINFTDGNGTPQFRAVGSFGNNSCTGRTVKWNFVRADGGTDTCGNIPTNYPSPGNVPTNYYNNNTIINVGGNSVSVPITIIPTLFAPVNIFRPEFNVDVGGINVNFSLGGVKFSPSFNLNVPITLPGTDPRTNPPPALPPSGDGNTSECDLDPVLELLNELLDCDRCEVTYETRQTSYGAAKGRIISIPPNTRRVDVDITSLGIGVDAQLGEGSPNVYQVGWYAFGTADGFSDRKPISYLSNTFYPPSEATQFTYQCKKNSEATVNVIYEVEQNT